MVISVFLVVFALWSVIDWAGNARRHRSESVEAVIEFPARTKAAVRIVAGAVYLVGVGALFYYRPQMPGYQLIVAIVALGWMSVVSFVLNKRVALAGRRVIDISFNGRHRELPIAAPVRYEPAWSGEFLHLRARDVFLPGSSMDGGTPAARVVREKFNALLMARAADAAEGELPVGSPDRLRSSA